MNHKPGANTLQEILGQFTSWQATLEGLTAQEAEIDAQIRQWGARDLALCGCGSTYYLAQVAASAIQSLTGARARAFPSSELWLFPAACYGTHLPDLLIAVSRSGETTETLRAVRGFKALDAGRVLAITCVAQSALADEAALCVMTRDVLEASIVQTRSFTSMLLAALFLAARMAGRPDCIDELRALPGLGQQLTDRARTSIAEIGESRAVERIFFLGSGPYFGLACEGMLKMKESALSQSEAYNFLEFRHGPMSLVDRSSLVVGLLSDTARSQEVAVLEQMAALGADVCVLTGGAEGVGGWTDWCFDVGSELGEQTRGLLYMPLLQLLAYHRAISRGLDPDQPRNLTAAVIL